VKCSHCARALGTVGFCVSLVSPTGKTYTATIHDYCLQALIGRDAERKITRLCVDAGWEQPDLPAFLLEIPEARARP